MIDVVLNFYPCPLVHSAPFGDRISSINFDINTSEDNVSKINSFYHINL